MLKCVKLEQTCNTSERSLNARLRNANDWIIEIKLFINLRDDNYTLGAHLYDDSKEQDRLTSLSISSNNNSRRLIITSEVCHKAITTLVGAIIAARNARVYYFNPAVNLFLSTFPCTQHAEIYTATIH